MDKVLLVERAKMYLKMLCEGVHPINGKELPKDFLDEKLKSCFSFINETLDDYIKLTAKVEQLESEKEKNTIVILKKENFSITQEQCNAIKLSKKPLSILAFMKKINEVVDTDSMEKFSSTRLNKWLVARGLFSEAKIQTIVNRTVYNPSELAEKIGITANEYIDKKSGEVKRQIRLDEKAQLFIIENLQEIIKIT